MNATQRAALLTAWIQPSSANEQQQQDRAWRMVKDAVDKHPAFTNARFNVYAKGSYANNTNVRLDSDVDIVVENQECRYYRYNGCTEPQGRRTTPYVGEWTPEKWRREVGSALGAAFGTHDVDTSGKVALTISSKSGSRPSVDVVPSFDFIRYDSSDHSRSHRGSKVFPTNGQAIENFPDQQLQNGRAKNDRTGRRYKNYARALKNAENRLVKDGVLEALPSYFMECLAWNVPDTVLTHGDLDAGFQNTLTWLWQNLGDNYRHDDWVEPNGLKWLFNSDSKWTPSDGRDLVLGTWKYLGYGG